MKKTIPLVATTALAGILSLGGTAAPAQARERLARCVVESPQTLPYRGPCLFDASRDGSFMIAPPRGRRFVGDVTGISLDMVRRGIGEVRGVTTAGINSRWGRAARSRRDPACWIGPDFRVCAY